MRRSGVAAFGRNERFYLDSSFLEEKLCIKGEMERRGLTYASLGAIYGVSPTFMRAIFAGTKASKDIYLKLERDFDVVLVGRVKPLEKLK